MRKIYGFILPVIVLLSVVFLCPARQAAAEEELKPFFVLSISGYDALAADLDHIGKLGENPNLSKAVEAFLKNMTQGKGLAGVDKKRPWGIVVLPNPDNLESDTRSFGFVPITDYDKLLETLESLEIFTEDGPDGSKEITNPTNVFPRNMFIKKVGDWAFITNNPDHFKHAPADPAALLGKDAKNYDIMASLRVKDIPQPMKDVFIGQMEMVVQVLEMQDGNEEAVTQMKQSVEQVKKYVEGLDAITFGLVINDPKGKTYLDTIMTAMPETEVAKEMAAIKMGPSAFAGFYDPKATVTLNTFSQMTPTNAQPIVNLIKSEHAGFLENLENQDVPKERYNRVKQLTGDVVDVLVKTLQADQIDCGVTAWLATNKATLIAGATVTDTKKLDKAIRGLAQMMIDESSELKKLIQLDAKTHKGITLHAFQIPMAALGDQGPWADLVGENLEVVIGTGPKDAYLAAGRGAMDRLIEAIDASKKAAGQDVLPARASLSVGQLVEFLSVAADDDSIKQQASMVSGVLKAAAGDKDHLVLTTKPIPGGMRQRLEIESGLLTTVGAMSQILSAVMTPIEVD